MPRCSHGWLEPLMFLEQGHACQEVGVDSIFPGVDFSPLDEAKTYRVILSSMIVFSFRGRH